MTKQWRHQRLLSLALLTPKPGVDPDPKGKLTLDQAQAPGQCGCLPGSYASVLRSGKPWILDEPLDDLRAQPESL